MSERRVLYVTKDLMFSSRVSTAARQRGVSIKVVGSAKQVADQLTTGGVSLLIVDLETPLGSLSDLLTPIEDDAETGEMRTICYAPHGQVGRLKEAREAGFQTVLTRGQFDEKVVEILDELADSES